MNLLLKVSVLSKTIAHKKTISKHDQRAIKGVPVGYSATQKFISVIILPLANS